MALVGSIVDELLELVDDGGAPDMPLIGGSMYIFRSLSVHPAFQGQKIGAKLMVHALWAHHRAPGDLAILLTGSIPNYFKDGEPPRVEQTPEACNGLAEYYARIGFKRVPTRSGKPEPCVPMWLHSGEGGLPVKGIGWMGERERI